MGRSVIGMCALVGGIVGSYLPEVWGASGFSVSSLLFGAVGGITGIWLGARISEV